jgi:hypothetical protein
MALIRSFSRLLRQLVAAAAPLAVMAVHSPADAACSVGKIAELPVTMRQQAPMIDAKINGAPVRFVADSGAFYSVISPGAAQTLHLTQQANPFGFYVIGVNGVAPAGVVTVKTFTLAGVDIPDVNFIVAGSEVVWRALGNSNRVKGDASFHGPTAGLAVAGRSPSFSEPPKSPSPASTARRSAG